MATLAKRMCFEESSTLLKMRMAEYLRFTFVRCIQLLDFGEVLLTLAGRWSIELKSLKRYKMHTETSISAVWQM